MKLYERGYTDAALSVALNLSKSAVAEWRRSNDLPANTGQRIANAPRMPKPHSYKPAPKGAMCGTCKHWEPDKPENETCKQCDQREMCSYFSITSLNSYYPITMLLHLESWASSVVVVS